MAKRHRLPPTHPPDDYRRPTITERVIAICAALAGADGRVPIGPLVARLGGDPRDAHGVLDLLAGRRLKVIRATESSARPLSHLEPRLEGTRARWAWTRVLVAKAHRQKSGKAVKPCVS